MYLVAYEAQTPRKGYTGDNALLSKSRKRAVSAQQRFDLAYLACGSISVFANPSLSRSFDFGGGWLLVKEAGGIFTDIKGNPIEAVEISLKKNTSLLASGNEGLHKEALRLLTQ